MADSDVFFVSTSTLMRGFDYHSSSDKGVALLVAHHLPSPRSVRQALGRVGRGGQTCRRFLLQALEATKGVDESQHSQQTGKLALQTVTSSLKKTPTVGKPSTLAGQKRTRSAKEALEQLFKAPNTRASNKKHPTENVDGAK